MSITASGTRLTALTRDLASKWEITKDYWADAKSREFEERFMKELMGSVNRTAASIQELEKIMAKVRSDCE